MNDNLTDIITPIQVNLLESLLKESEYDSDKTRYLVSGFRCGFNLEYEGPLNRQDTSENIPIKAGVGSEEELWHKMMKEVTAHRFAGPFKQIPFKDNFIQSPVGLVPKAGNQTRLIFHLSYDFKGGNKLVNHFIPAYKCSVKYNDLDHALRGCLRLTHKFPNKNLWFGVSDLKSAFRLIPLLKKCWPLLVMKARHPVTGKWMFFVDKCLPFGAAISCVIFQHFSNALAHITRFRLSHMIDKSITNYLDDFSNIAVTQELCNGMLVVFHTLCEDLKVLLAKEKTVWAMMYAVFLGVLLNGKRFLIALPVEKIKKAVDLLRIIIDKKKTTVKEVQQLTCLLNFFNRAIYPGRAFTRRMYAKIEQKTNKMHPYHHVYLDAEFRGDCRVWLAFLNGRENGLAFCRPFMDLDLVMEAEELGFFTDSSACKTLGFGAVLGDGILAFWSIGRWIHCRKKAKHRIPRIVCCVCWFVCMVQQVPE